MYRFRNNRIISLYSKCFQSFVLQTKYERNVGNCLALNAYSSQSDAIDVSKSIQNNKNFADIREKRIQVLKRNIPSGDYDVLSEAIIKSASVEQLLELVSMHVNVMNNRHLADVFESMHDLIRMSDNYNEECLKVLSSQEFNQLCNQSVRRMRFFSTSDIITSLKTLILMSVSPNTTIVQSLLQMTRQLINDFSLQEIIFLDFLINKKFVDKRDESEANKFPMDTMDEPIEPPTPVLVPLVEALKLALPLVLQLKIESKELNFDDIDLVVKCLRTAAKHNLKDELINRLTGAVSVKLNELSVSQMYSVIASLISISFVNSNVSKGLVDRVINECLDRVTAPGVQHPNNLPQNFILSLVTHSKTRRDYYHKGLYEMVANLIIQNPNKFHNSRISAVLWALTRQSHVHYGLLDLMADKIANQEPDIIANTKISFTNILVAFSLPSNYRPNEPNSEVVYKTMFESNHLRMCRQKTKHLLFKILRHLSVLSYYPKQEITDWIHDYLNDAISMSTVMGLRIEFLENILILYQGLCLESDITDCEDTIQVLKPFVDELIAFQSKDLENSYKSESLQFALAQGLGGQQFVANNMFTDFGHLVDHVVVMRKGGYPVAIGGDQKRSHIKHLDVPNDSKIVGIIALTARDYCREPRIRKAETDFRIRTLKKTGITPIPVNLEGWESLAELEKIPYIMREIQENSEINVKQTHIH